MYPRARSLSQLSDFRKIIQSHWKARLFNDSMQKAAKETGKDDSTEWMERIRGIRNSVMHPSKRNIHKEDLEALSNANRIVREFSALMADTNNDVDSDDT